MARKRQDTYRKLNADDLFDDCAVCQAMKFAEKEGREPTIEELRQSFRAAREQGGVVGGSIIDDD